MSSGPPEYDEDKRMFVQHAAIANASAAAISPPSKAEFDDLVSKFNHVLEALRGANIVEMD